MYYTFRDAHLPLTISAINGAPNPLTVEVVVVSLLKPGTTDFVEFALNPGSDDVLPDFQLIENNIYKIRIPGVLLSTFGEYLIKLEVLDDPILRNILGTQYFNFSVAESERRSVATPDNETCILVGNVKDLSGRIPKWNDIEVTYKPYFFPQVNENAVLTADTIKTRTDIDGHFEMPCIRGAMICFEIPRCGLRMQYTVPFDQDVVDMVAVYNSIVTS